MVPRLIFFHRARTLQASQPVRAWTFLSRSKTGRNHPKFANTLIKVNVNQTDYYLIENQKHGAQD